MRTQQNPLYSLLNPHFFEPIERLAPDGSEYLDAVREMLPVGWETPRSGTWFQCSAPGYAIPPQGWKLHVSATTANAVATLRAVARVLARENVTFKFACDATLLWLLNSKRWDRGASGKFITVYPRDDEHFRRLAAALHEATRDLAGPYILSDRRYKDSRCVHYRYGAMVRTGERNVFGRATSTLVGPGGASAPDQRIAAFSPPPWVADPFPEEAEVDGEEPGTLCRGRYLVEEALAYSNSGGVYAALDRHTGARVVIKEARPYTSWTSEQDNARALLRKEYRILRKLEATGVAVRPLGYFTDWEHEFMVEERLTGMTLGTRPSRGAVLLRPRPAEEDFVKSYADFRAIFLRLCEIVETVHRHGIVFCDLSPHNLIYDEETGRLTAIDFEAAYEPGVDVPTALATDGFVASNGTGSAESDVYSLGAVMLHAIFNYTSLLQLSPASIPAVVEDVCRSARIPPPVRDAIARAMDARPETRATVHDVAAALRENEHVAPAVPDPEWDQTRVRAMLDGVLAYIVRSADPGREDRLFPACFRMFETNPLALWYGAAGTAFALHRVTGAVPSEVMGWIDAHRLDPERCAPGFMVGLAGIAWALLEVGRPERAAEVLAACERHPRLAESCDLGVGLAGWGMTCLRFFRASGDERYLALARDAAAMILERAETDLAGRRFWTASDGVHVGMLHGSSGIALFLLQLGLAAGDESLVAAGRSALDFDLAQARPGPDGGITFGYRTDFFHIVLPYWAYGSAGIGTVLLRYLRATGADELRVPLDGIALDAERKYTVLSGKQYGLAGIGGFNLDAYALTGEPRFLHGARRAFDGIALHAVPRDEGIAFCGDFQGKISCDYATGSAGVAVFLDRLLTGRGTELMLDEER